MLDKLNQKKDSFESRMRELIRKMYHDFSNTDSMVFKPEKHEIGMVFMDNTPIEIDAFGTYIREGTMHLLVGEIKNINKLVDTSEMNKFLKKIDFIYQRYSTIARLSSLNKAVITNKILISSSGFDPSIISFSEKNSIEIFNKEAVKELLKKYGQFTIP